MTMGKYVRTDVALTGLSVSIVRCHLPMSMYLSINIHSQVPFLVCRNQ